MKKIAAVCCSMSLALSAFIIAPAFADSSSKGGGFVQPTMAQGGGFSGPGPGVLTVQEAKNMRDDTPVRLRGNITSYLGKDKYLFQDATGTITVEIDNDEWGGQTITPDDTVEIFGEMDKDWNSIEIDVDRVSRM